MVTYVDAIISENTPICIKYQVYVNIIIYLLWQFTKSTTTFGYFSLIRGGEIRMVHPVTYGKRVRMSYSRIDEVLELPDLIEVQRSSYEWFLEEGLKEVFDDISPIQDYTGNLILEFVDYHISEEPKYDEDEARERDANFSAPLKVKVRLINKETGEIKEQEVFMGDFPLMTEKGTFIINGAERVVVSQLVRSPGVYYAEEIDKVGKKNYILRQLFQ